MRELTAAILELALLSRLLLTFSSKISKALSMTGSINLSYRLPSARARRPIAHVLRRSVASSLQDRFIVDRDLLYRWG